MSSIEVDEDAIFNVAIPEASLKYYGIEAFLKLMSLEDIAKALTKEGLDVDDDILPVLRKAEANDKYPYTLQEARDALGGAKATIERVGKYLSFEEVKMFIQTLPNNGKK